jgi:hypothetical protein
MKELRVDRIAVITGALKDIGAGLGKAFWRTGRFGRRQLCLGLGRQSRILKIEDDEYK